MQETMQFQHYITAAIDCYVQDRRGKISQDRPNDIAHIKKILGRTVYDYSKQKKSLSHYLNNMRTGWGFLQTGNSRLKASIQAKIKEFKKRHTKVLLTPNGNIQLRTKEPVKKAVTLMESDFFLVGAILRLKALKKVLTLLRKKEIIFLDLQGK